MASVLLTCQHLFSFQFCFLTEPYLLFEVATAEAKICECRETSSSKQGKTFVVCSQTEEQSRQILSFFINILFPSLWHLTLSFSLVALKRAVQSQRSVGHQAKSFLVKET